MESWAEAASNPVNGTIQNLRDRVAEHHALGTNLFMPYFLALVADVALRAKLTDTCGAALDEAETFLERTGERWWDTEVQRLRGELLIATDGDLAQAEDRFQVTLVRARERRAKAFELRAATSLARLWQRQGKQDKGRKLLAPMYDWFTEGLDTADLQAARLLISVLDAPDAKAVAD